MGCVYFAKRQNEDVYKIGSAESLPSRMKDHATTDLIVARVIDCDSFRDCESFLHEYYESRRVQGTREFFRFTPDEIVHAIDAAEAFNSRFVQLQMQVRQLSGKECENRLIAADAHACETYHELRRIKEQEFRLSVRREFLENELKLLIGLGAGIQGVASWKSYSFTSFNRTAFKSEQPDTYARYCSERIQRRFLLQ